jgi:ribA/ribD-fused uncharacterized protein
VEDEALAERDQLIELERAGTLPPMVMFWGHRPRQGTTGPGPWVLSQWFPAEFVVDGRRYATAEHWMMAEKARLFADADAESRVFQTDDPAEVQAVGRSVRGFDHDRWEAHRFGAVVAGSLAKFGQDRELRDYLLSTVGKVLVEASPRDAIWGIGVDCDDPRAARPSEWPGRNLLGFALMEARRTLGDGSDTLPG